MKRAGFLSIALELICVAQTVTLLSDRAQGLSSPALSPDLTTLAYESRGSDYSMWIDARPLGGGKVTHVAGWQDNGGPISPRWSPDGKRIAFLRIYCHSCNHELFIKNFPHGPEKLLGEVCGGTPSWTPDGRFLIATESAGGAPGWSPCRLVRISLDGGPRMRLAKDGDELALTADGSRLAYAAGNIVKVVPLDANYRFADSAVEIAREPHAISSLFWSADGQTLVYRVRDYTKAVTGGTVRLITTGARIAISQILPDGAVLGTETRGSSALWRVDLKAARPVPEKIRNVPWTDEYLSVSADGQWLAFNTARNGATQIWVSRINGSESRVLVPAIPTFDHYGDNTFVSGLSWSPDGSLIAMETQPGIGHGDMSARTFVVPAAGGRLRKVVDFGFMGRAPVWTGNGKALYIAKYSESYTGSYFLVAIDTGAMTPVAAEYVPQLPLYALPQGASPPHVAQGGRFLYYLAPVTLKPRLVKIDGLIPVAGPLP